MLHGQLAPEVRQEIVEAVQAGAVEVLVATLQLISEGFDCPGLATLFLTTPISFEGRLLQVIGRIMRPAANKRARVFDYIDENVPTLLRSARARSLVLVATLIAYAKIMVIVAMDVSLVFKAIVGYAI